MKIGTVDYAGQLPPSPITSGLVIVRGQEQVIGGVDGTAAWHIADLMVPLLNMILSDKAEVIDLPPGVVAAVRNTLDRISQDARDQIMAERHRRTGVLDAVSAMMGSRHDAATPRS